NPDANQLTRDIMPLGKRVQALPGNELLGDLPLELNAVGTLWGHGFHPLKPSSPCQITNLKLSGPRGALHTAAKSDIGAMSSGPNSHRGREMGELTGSHDKGRRRHIYVAAPGLF